MTDKELTESISFGMQAATQVPAMQLGIITSAAAALAKVAEVAHMIGRSQSEIADISEGDERLALVEKVLRNLRLRDFALQQIEGLLSTIKNEPSP